MKKGRPELPIEPLSDAAWKRVDEAVFAALDEDVRPESYAPPPVAITKKPRWPYAAAAVAIAAAVLLFVFFRAPHAPTEPTALNPSHIETGDAPSRLALGESTVEIGAGSAVVASGTDATGILVVLERGKVDCEVAPRKQRPPFVVQAGTPRVRVVGTRFTVLRDGQDVKVAVAHGAVEVSRGADVVMLHDGETWPPPAAPPPAPTTSAAPVPSTTTAPAVPARPAFDPQRAYETAARTEASDPEGAMVTYRKIAAGGGAWAPTALFAAGRLAADRGQRAEARRLLEDYLARYPKGANAEDARGILARLR
jgi:hypothetical protein